MTDLVYDFISSGVDLLMTASVLSAVIVLLQVATILTNITAQQQANAYMIDYYREFNHLDSKQVSTVDIQSFILRYYKNIQCKIVFAKPNGVNMPSNPNYLTVDNGVIVWHEYKKVNNVWKYVTTNVAIEDLTSFNIWNYNQVWHSILREDGENINDLWGTNFNTFKNNYYDGGSITGIYAIYSN